MFHWSLETASADTTSNRAPNVFRTLSVEDLLPPESISLELTGTPHAEVTRIQRVNLLNGRAADHWTIWTVLKLPDSAYRAGLPDDINWYEYVSQITNQDTFTMSRRTVNYRATRSDTRLLDVEVGDPLRFTTRSLTAADGTPVDRSWGRTNSQLSIPFETFTIRV